MYWNVESDIRVDSSSNSKCQSFCCSSFLIFQLQISVIYCINSFMNKSFNNCNQCFNPFLTGHFVNALEFIIILSIFGQFVHWSFCAVVILCIGHFVHSSFCALVILCIGHFVHWSFCALVILCIGHFVHWSFCELVILWISHFVYGSFFWFSIFISGHISTSHFAIEAFCKWDIFSPSSFSQSKSLFVA